MADVRDWFVARGARCRMSVACDAEGTVRANARALAAEVTAWRREMETETETESFDGFRAPRAQSLDACLAGTRELSTRTSSPSISITSGSAPTTPNDIPTSILQIRPSHSPLQPPSCGV